MWLLPIINFGLLISAIWASFLGNWLIVISCTLGLILSFFVFFVFQYAKAVDRLIDTVEAIQATLDQLSEANTRE